MPQPKARPPAISGQPFRDDDPRFSVIVVDYEPSVPREVFRRKMACLAEQTCKDFEVLVYHDGPKAQSYQEDLGGAPFHPDTQFIVTPTRAGDWGHSNRDLGIRAARGRWIIHTNADNVFYPNLIATLKAALDDPQDWAFLTMSPRNRPPVPKWLARLVDRHFSPTGESGRVLQAGRPQALVYAIVLRGMVPLGQVAVRVPDLAQRQGIVLGGFPVQYGKIDAMQMVLRRDLWLAEGGWHNRSMNSDGELYPVFARKYRVLPVPVVLGEHW
jgi:hypothetical protein